MSVKLQSQSFERPESLEQIVSAAGFSEVSVLVEPFDWIGAEAEECWAAQWSMSSRAGLERLEPAAVERLKQEVFQHMQALRQPDGFHELLRAQFTLARKP